MRARRCSPTRPSRFDGELRAPRRRRARLRVPGAPAQGRADLHRRHRHEDDGARPARSPTACVLNYLVSPAYNAAGARARWPVGADAGRSHARRHRPAPARRVLDATRTAQAALDNARLLVTQYLGQQPHIMKASGVPESLLDEIGKVLTWPATHEQVVAAVEAGARRDRADDHGVGHARRVPGQGRPSTCAAGCTCPILYPLGDDVRAMIDAFAGWTASAHAGPAPCTPCRTCRRRASYPRTCCRCHVRRTRRRGRRSGMLRTRQRRSQRRLGFAERRPVVIENSVGET